MEYFGSNLKHFRGYMHQEVIGKKFGVSNSQWGHYESGFSKPGLIKAFEIADYFDFTLDDFCRKDLTHIPSTDGNGRKALNLKPPNGSKAHKGRETPVAAMALQEMDVGGVSTIGESPPQKKVKDMERKLLEMMLELQDMKE